MSKQSKIWGILSFLMIAILACNIVVPSPINSTATDLTEEIIEGTPTLWSTAPVRPGLLPSETPSHVPANSQAITTFLPPAASTPAQVDILDACTLVSVNELSGLFPNPPAPAHDLKMVDGDSLSTCSFISKDMTVEISVLSFPDYTEFNDIMNNIKATPDFAQFSVSEANIYQTLWPTSEAASGHALAAIIVKGDLEVQIIGTSKMYKYDRVRESLFLTRIAERLPSIKSTQNPCALVTVDELWALFPSPPIPNNELNTDEGYPLSVCKYISDEVEVTISMAENLDLARQLSEEAEYVMSVSDLFTHLSVSGAQIYLMGGHSGETVPGDILNAIIIKDDISIRIVASGKSYEYDPERESQLLETIAGRLP